MLSNPTEASKAQSPTGPLAQEAQQHLLEVRAALSKGAHQARHYLEAFSSAVRERLLQAEVEASKALESSRALAEHLTKPGALDLRTRMQLRHRAELALVTMLRLELESNQDTLALLAKLPTMEPDPEGKLPPIRVAQEEPAYQIAAIEQDVALIRYHLFRERHAHEVIRQAAGQAHRLPLKDPMPFQHPLGLGDPKNRAEVLQRLRGEMQANQALFVLVGHLASQLEEAEALAQWAEGALGALKALPPAALARSLGDADWRKLNGAVLALGAFPERVKGHGLLAQLLPGGDWSSLSKLSPLPSAFPKLSKLLPSPQA